MSRLKEMNRAEVPEQDTPFTTEWLRVSELQVDPEAQRDHLDMKKVERIHRLWNDSAVGVIVVSRRDPVTQIVIDGMHRRQAFAEKTDGAGYMLCHVYDGLTPEEESQMFLDLNYGNKPTPLDTFRHEIRAGHEKSVEIDKLVRAFQWKVEAAPGNGSIQAVAALKRIYQRSVDRGDEPNMLLMTLKVLTNAWGHDRDAVAAVMLEGFSAFLTENIDRIDTSELEKMLSGYGGGPYAFHQNATQLAGFKRGRVSMAVAELLATEWNKRHKGKNQIPEWKKRSV